MRWLIDGYNVMHAGGRLGPKLCREGFRRARRRFLDDLADALGPGAAAETTVVFDASAPPGDFPLDSTFRGLGVLFALGDENADARIESLISRAFEPQETRRRFLGQSYPRGRVAAPLPLPLIPAVLGAARRPERRPCRKKKMKNDRPGNVRRRAAEPAR